MASNSFCLSRFSADWKCNWPPANRPLSIRRIPLDAAPDTSHRRRLVRLAFLAPDLQRAILAGEQPENLTLARFLETDLPLSWAAQRRMFEAIASENHQRRG